MGFNWIKVARKLQESESDEREWVREREQGKESERERKTDRVYRAKVHLMLV